MPWDGKEQLFCNVSFPLRAILEVRRSETTYIRALSYEQKRSLLLRQCFIPMWNTPLAAQLIAVLSRAAQVLPIYRLFCGPDAASAKAAYELLQDPHNILEAREDMRIKKGFVLRNVVGEHIVMPTDENVAKFEGAVVLNEVSAFLFEALKDSISRDDLLEKLLGEYDVDRPTAESDLDATLASFEELGLLDTEA